MFEKLAQHKIIDFKGRFFCSLCMCEMPSLKDVSYHINQKEHLELKSAAFSIKDYVAETQKLLSSDNTSICIRFAFICIPCKKVVAALEDVLQHIRSANHGKRLRNTYITCDEINSAMENVTDDNTQGIFYDLDSLYKDLHSWRKDCFSKLLEAYEKKHEFSSSNCETLVCNKVIIYEYCQLICDICGKTFREPFDIQQHMEAKAHNIFELKYEGEEDEYKEEDEYEDEGEDEDEYGFGLGKYEDEEEDEDEYGFGLGKFEDEEEDKDEYGFGLGIYEDEPKDEDDLKDENEYEDEWEDEDELEDGDEYKDEWKDEGGYEVEYKDDNKKEEKEKEKEQTSRLKCELCNCELPSEYHEVQHLLGKRHNKLLERLIAGKDSNENILSNLVGKVIDKKEQMNSAELQKIPNVVSDSNLNINKRVQKKLLENGVTIHGSTKFSCAICDRKIDTLHNIESHIKGWTHKDNLKRHNSSSSVTRNDTDVNRMPIVDLTNNLEIANDKCNLSSKPLVPLRATTNQGTSIPTVSGSEESIDKTIRDRLLNNQVTIHGPDKFSCTICDRKMLSLQDIQSHVKGKSHKCNLKRHNSKSSVTKNDSDVNRMPIIDLTNSLEVAKDKCSLSSKLLVPLRATTNQSTSISTVSGSEEGIDKAIREKLLNNLVTIHGPTKFMCTICDRKIDTLHNIELHVKGWSHKDNLKSHKSRSSVTKNDTDVNRMPIIDLTNNLEIANDKYNLSSKPLVPLRATTNQSTSIPTVSGFEESIDKTIRDRLLNNQVTIHGPDKFSCTICDRKMLSLHDIQSHVKGKSHKCNLKSHNSKSSVIKNDSDVNPIPIIDLCNSLEDVEETCSLSSIPFTSTSASIDSKDEIVCILDDSMENESKEIPGSDKRHCCMLCNVQIDIDRLFDHLDSSTHKCNIRFTSMGDDIVLYKCFCCKSIMQGNISFVDHLSSSSHSSNLRNYFKCLEPNGVATFTRAFKSIQENHLSLCAVLIPKVENARSWRFNEEPIVAFDVSSIKSSDGTKRNVYYYCLRCRIILQADQNLLSHCQGRMHLWRIKQLFVGDRQPEVDTVVTLTKQLNGLSICDQNRDVPSKFDYDYAITRGIDAEITEALNKPLHSPKKPAKDDKKSLTERLNKKYDKRCLDIEVKMYDVEEKLICIERNFKSIVRKRKHFYCFVCNENVSQEFHLLYEHVCCESHRMQIEIIRKEPESKKLLDEYMRKGSKNKTECFPCKKVIKSDEEAVKHINNATHKRNLATLLGSMDKAFRSISQELNDNLWYSIQRYSCVPCKSNFKHKMEFVRHIVATHAQSSKNSFDFCIPCTTLWLDQNNSYTEHCKDITHRYLIKNRDFMIEDLPDSMKTILTQADEISDLLFRQTQVLLNDNIQQEVTRSLENIMRPNFPHVKAFVFGSRVTGLGFANSDIDVYLDCDNTYNRSNNEDAKKKPLRRIEAVLHKHNKEWEVKAVLEDTRIPIIKSVYKPTGIHCDISITHGLSVENSKLIRSFNDAYLPCRKLILFIKKWFSQFDLPGRHGLTNYALAWLAIFYLQSESYLPSVAVLIKQENQSRLICGWETGVAKPKDNNKSARPVSTLLAGFFEFYANFNYRDHVVCPLMGKPVPKRAFAELIVPIEMKPYLNHLIASKDVEYFRIDSPLCVQDPFDLSHNLTKAVTSITLRCFRRYCRDSASMLKTLRAD